MDPEDGQDSQVESVEVQPDISQDQPIEAGTGMNPAWSELLSDLPAGLHSQITPHLSKWDQNFQTKINEVHSQYEVYKPFLENQVAPDQINYALGILQAIEDRPDEVLKALQAYVGISNEPEVDTEQQGQTNPQDAGPEQPEWLQHPEYQRMSNMVDTMAQLLVQQRQSETDAQMDSQLDTDLTAAKEQFGEYDEEWVLTKLYNNADMTVAQAVEAYKEFESGVLNRNRQPGPPVLGPGGSVPNPSFQPGKLDDKGRRATVAQMLQQAQANNH